MEERRFDDDEVAEIFRQAATPGSPELPAEGSSVGMTLAELQDIGREIGVLPERIAAAAVAIGRSGGAERRKSFGMPISVGRTVELPRAPTDREWDVLVGELREVFDAPGKDSSRGEARRWSNGNLFAVVEPTVAGHRLRLGTRKSDALAYNLTGSVFLLMGLVAMIGMLAAGQSFEIGAVMLSLVGAGLVGYNAIRLPKWSDERERQMEHIGARALALIARGDGKTGDGADPI